MEKMKIIFGINGETLLQNQDSFVSIIKEGKIVVCSEKERFIRIKYASEVIPVFRFIL